MIRKWNATTTISTMMSRHYLRRRYYYVGAPFSRTPLPYYMNNNNNTIHYYHNVGTNHHNNINTMKQSYRYQYQRVVLLSTSATTKLNTIINDTTKMEEGEDVIHNNNNKQSIPLPNLHQGTSLSILFSSQLFPLLLQQQQQLQQNNSSHDYYTIPPIYIEIQPTWRDDGHIECIQILENNSSNNNSNKYDNDVPMYINVREGMNDDNNINNNELQQHQHHDDDSKASSHYNNKHQYIVELCPSIDMITTMTKHFHDKNYNDNKKDNSHDDNNNKHGIYITIQVPEKLDTLICDLTLPSGMSSNYYNGNGGSVTITNKIEANSIKIYTNEQNIITKKLRAHIIELSTTSNPTNVTSSIEKKMTTSNNTTIRIHDNDDSMNIPSLSLHNPIIYSSHLLEAQTLQVSTTGRFRAKQIHCNDTHIDMNKQTYNYNKIGEMYHNHHSLLLDDDDGGAMVDISSFYVSGNDGGAIIDVTKHSIDDQHNVISELNNEHIKDGNEITRTTNHYNDNHQGAVRIKSQHGPVQIHINGLSQSNIINEITNQYYPFIDLGGVNGSCEVFIKNTQTKQQQQKQNNNKQFNNNNDDDDDHNDNDYTSCKIHFDRLSNDTISLINSDYGRIELTVDRKVEADIRLLSITNPIKTNDDHDGNNNNIIQDHDTDHDDDKLMQITEMIASLSSSDNEQGNDVQMISDQLKKILFSGNNLHSYNQQQHSINMIIKNRILILSKAFQIRDSFPHQNMLLQQQLQSNDEYNSKIIKHDNNHDDMKNRDYGDMIFQYIDGYIDNQSHEPDSRFDRKYNRTDDTGGVGKIRLDYASDSALLQFSDKTGSTSSNNSTINQHRPLIVAVGYHDIVIETVSWLGSIARRYGLDDEYIQHEKDRMSSGGRTASRRGRRIVFNDDGDVVLDDDVIDNNDTNYK